MKCWTDQGFILSVGERHIKGENILSTEGDQTREFNYVDNIIDGLISTISKKECIGEVINISLDVDAIHIFGQKFVSGK